MTAFRVTSLGPANNATAPQLGEKERQRPPPPSLVGWFVFREGGSAGAALFPLACRDCLEASQFTPPPPSPRLTVFLAQPGMAHRREGGVCVWPEGKLRKAHGPPGDDGGMGTGVGGIRAGRGRLRGGEGGGGAQ